MKILVKVKIGLEWSQFTIDTEIIKEKSVQTTQTSDGRKMLAHEVY